MALAFFQNDLSSEADFSSTLIFFKRLETQKIMKYQLSVARFRRDMLPASVQCKRQIKFDFGKTLKPPAVVVR